MSGRHEPVLVEETLRFWRNGDGLYLDATLGDGGHTDALLAAEPGARVLGCDRDPEAIASARARLARWGSRVVIAQAAFHDLPQAHARAGGEPLAGALLDLGVSSRQLDDPARGMSFRGEGPLDLRMDPTSGEPASAWLARAEEAEVADALRRHADIRDARPLARRLKAAARAGRLLTTGDLVHVVAGARRAAPSPKTLAPLFQALRMQVNDESGELAAALEWLPRAVRPSGVVVTLAYHSGEDRLVKHSLRGSAPVPSRRLPPVEPSAPSPWEPLTRRVVTPSAEEISKNPRARSARLRAFRRRPL